MKRLLLCLLLCASICGANAQDNAAQPAAPANLDSLLPVRGFCISAPRPSGLDSFLTFIRQELIPRKVNTLILMIDYHYQFESHPELRDSFALSRKDAREIVKVCREGGIRIIPEIDLLGHQSWANHLGMLLKVYPQFDETPNVQMPEKYVWPNPDNLYCKSYSPLAPGLHDVLFPVIDELCDAFDATAFHAGMDEVFYIADPHSPYDAGMDPSQLFAGEVRAIHDHLAEKHRELWIWGDRLLDGKTTGLGIWEASYNNTYRAVDMIPKDVVICDWHYERADYTPVYFAMKGFRVVTCPFRRPETAVAQMNDMLRFRSQSTVEMKERFLGLAQTVWSPASAFLRGYYEPAAAAPEGTHRRYNPEETAQNTFRSLFDHIDKLEGGATASATNVPPIRSIDPADTDFDDLAALGKAVEGARIVLLGENTHGEGSTFLAKTRIVKYLHEKLGFDVLAFESGLYDCARIWENVEDGSTVPKEVPGSLFYMYATSEQTQGLFTYIQDQLRSPDPLVLTGFESQHTGLKAKTDLFPDFTRFLQAHDPGLVDDNWTTFEKVSLSTFGSADYRPSADDQQTFLKEIRLLKNALTGDDAPVVRLTDSKGFWYQVVCSIESQATRYWKLVQGNEVSVRDMQMAQNLIWLAEHGYRGHKIIVWAHNGHIAKNTSLALRPLVLDGPDNNRLYAFESMGTTIHRYFGAKAYAIGFMGGGGSYMNYVNSQIVNVGQPGPNSVEGLLSAEGSPFAFVDLHHAPPALEVSKQGSIGDYMAASAIWPDVFDGIFFIKDVYPVVRLSM